jgi:Uncharacterised nucleotidyltransferase
MTNASCAHTTEFPPLSRVAGVLAEVTETLARQLTSATEDPPRWTDLEWRIARAVTAMQGISSLLCAGLRWKIPVNWRRFLEEQRDHTAGRHLRIMALLESIDSQARREGIALVALKGAALYQRGIYNVGERPMADIDLLVRHADMNTMPRLLGTCDFDLAFVSWRHHLYESRVGAESTAGRFGEHIDNPIKIEVHTSIRERLPLSETDITQFLFPTEPRAGLNPYGSDAALMMHLLLHAAGNMRARALRLIQLHDISRLANGFRACDWEELLAFRPNNQVLWWAVPPLTLTAYYYPNVIPQWVLSRLGRGCPWLLRKFSSHFRLSDVSWSNPRVYAFPGMEWSRSLREACSFAISRAWPGRDALLELHHYAVTQPGVSEIPWYGISHAARIMRWLVSRPPRVQTMLSVRAALAQRYDADCCSGATENLAAERTSK